MDSIIELTKAFASAAGSVAPSFIAGIALHMSGNIDVVKLKERTSNLLNGRSNADDDKNKVIFDLDTTEQKIGHSASTVQRYYMKGADVLVCDGSHPNDTLEGQITKQLADYVEQNGTIDELCFLGHGDTNSMMVKGGGSINLPYLLSKIEDHNQSSDNKICDKIIFNGCGTFSDLTDRQVEDLQQYAQQNDVEIVGTTSNLTVVPYLAMTSRYVKFNTDGTFERDSWDKRYAAFSLIRNSSDWSDRIDQQFDSETPEMS